MCVLVGLTTVDKLEVFYINFCCFSSQKVLFLAINDAKASSPQGDAAIDSQIRILLVFNRNQAFPIYSTFNGIAGYDAIVLFPLGGAASDSCIRILKR